MKTFLTALALFPTIVMAALPQPGTYKCNGYRSFLNVPETTQDVLMVDYGLSQSGNPVVKISTNDRSISLVPSIFGGRETALLEPRDASKCNSGSAEEQIVKCAQASLPPLNASQNLFLTSGVQWVQYLKISDNFVAFSNRKGVRSDLAVLVSFRKSQSHWERIYSCTFVK